MSVISGQNESGFFVSAEIYRDDQTVLDYFSNTIACLYRKHSELEIDNRNIAVSLYPFNIYAIIWQCVLPGSDVATATNFSAGTLRLNGVALISMRRYYVALASVRCRAPAGFSCVSFSFLILSLLFFK